MSSSAIAPPQQQTEDDQWVHTLLDFVLQPAVQPRVLIGACTPPPHMESHEPLPIDGSEWLQVVSYHLKNSEFRGAEQRIVYLVKQVRGIQIDYVRRDVPLCIDVAWKHDEHWSRDVLRQMLHFRDEYAVVYSDWLTFATQEYKAMIEMEDEMQRKLKTSREPNDLKHVDAFLDMIPATIIPPQRESRVAQFRMWNRVLLTCETFLDVHPAIVVTGGLALLRLARLAGVAQVTIANRVLANVNLEQIYYLVRGVARHTVYSTYKYTPIFNRAWRVDMGCLLVQIYTRWTKHALFAHNNTDTTDDIMRYIPFTSSSHPPSSILSLEDMFRPELSPRFHEVLNWISQTYSAHVKTNFVPMRSLVAMTTACIMLHTTDTIVDFRRLYLYVLLCLLQRASPQKQQERGFASGPCMLPHNTPPAW
jgi:hypothetical protein